MQRQQQHLMQMQPMVASYDSPNNVTTDLIQQYLDENKQLILAILDNQTSGKVDDCAENEARLQRNLMYLAAIADSQPQMPTISQFPPGNASTMQPPRCYMQQAQQAQQMSPRSLMAARPSMMYAQSPLSGMHSRLRMTGGGNNGLHILHGEAAAPTMGGRGGLPDFGRGRGGGGGKQDGGAL